MSHEYDQKKESVVCLMSGGLDSFISAFLLKEKYNVYPLYVNYGHLSAELEIKVLLKQAQILDINKPYLIRIEGVSELLRNNLTFPGSQIDDFYPARNLMLLIFAAQYSHSLNINLISIGIIRSLREFADSSTDYLYKLSMIISSSINDKIEIITPVANITKRQEVSLFMNQGFSKDIIYSCQKGTIKHCGVCPSCMELNDAIQWVKL